MIVEVLYKDLMLHGDDANDEYLKKCLKGSTFIYTNIKDTPYFINNKVDVILMGSMTENNQEIVLKELFKYTGKIKELIDNNVIFIIYGNSLSLFGSHIEEEKNIKCLNIFDYYVKRDYEKRINKIYKGKYENIDILGHISSFDTIVNNNNPFIKEDNFGVHYNNFYGIDLTGPFLISNPLFIKKVFNIETLEYEEEIMSAYNERLKEYKEKNL